MFIEQPHYEYNITHVFICIHVYNMYVYKYMCVYVHMCIFCSGEEKNANTVFSVNSVHVSFPQFILNIQCHV